MNKLLIILAILVTLLFWQSRIASAEHIPILMYHNIQNEIPTGVHSKGAKDLFLPPENFWAQLLYIQQAGYQTVTFKDVRNQRYEGKKKIILTFDDGDENQWEAYDELLKRHMVAVFFPVLRAVNGNRKYLDRDQLRTMSRTGMEIGSHSMDHPVLSRTNAKKAEWEIRESKLELEAISGKEVITFCYPYGRYNKNIIKMLEEAGYYYGRTTNEKIADFGIGKNFELPVLYIHRNTDAESLRKVLEK